MVSYRSVLLFTMAFVLPCFVFPTAARADFASGAAATPVPKLIDELSAGVRVGKVPDAVYQGLVASGVKARAATPLLLRELGTRDAAGQTDFDSISIVDALGAIHGSIPLSDCDEILASLRSVDLTRLAAALYTLSNISFNAARRKDIDDSRRSELVDALLEVGRRYQSRYYMRFLVTSALVGLDPGPNVDGWRYIIERQSRDDNYEVKYVLSGNVQVTSADTGAIPALVEAVSKNEFGPDDGLYLRFLRGFGPKSAPATDSCIAVLGQMGADHNTGSYFRFQNAALLLADIGPAASRAEPAIVRALSNHPDPNLRYSLLLALARVGPRPDDMPLIADALRDDGHRSQVFVSACWAASALGSDGAQAVPLIVNRLKSQDDEGYFSADLEPFEYESLGSGYSTEHLELIRILGSFGPLAVDAVPELTKLATVQTKTPFGERYDERIADAAKEALAKIEPSAVEQTAKGP